MKVKIKFHEIRRPLWTEASGQIWITGRFVQAVFLPYFRAFAPAPNGKQFIDIITLTHVHDLIISKYILFLKES